MTLKNLCVISGSLWKKQIECSLDAKLLFRLLNSKIQEIWEAALWSLRCGLIAHKVKAELIVKHLTDVGRVHLSFGASYQCADLLVTAIKFLDNEGKLEMIDENVIAVLVKCLGIDREEILRGVVYSVARIVEWSDLRGNSENVERMCVESGIQELLVELGERNSGEFWGLLLLRERFGE
jgi:hypothetical protein